LVSDTKGRTWTEGIWIIGNRWWRRLHNEELNSLCASPNTVTVIIQGRYRWEEHVARVAEMKNAYNILPEKPEEKRTLGRPRRRWKYNIRMDLREIAWKVVDWIHRT
jgi:hypothetical protein